MRDGFETSWKSSKETWNRKEKAQYWKYSFYLKSSTQFLCTFAPFVSKFVLGTSIEGWERKNKIQKFEESKTFHRAGMIAYINNQKEFREKVSLLERQDTYVHMCLVTSVISNS